MKKSISRIFVMMLVLTMIFSQMSIINFAEGTTDVNCTCDKSVHTHVLDPETGKDKIDPETDKPIITNAQYVKSVAPTCADYGYDEYECTICHGKLIELTSVPTGKHTEETIPGKAPTCTETGLTEGKKCSVCGKILVAQEEIPALGHQNDAVVESHPATCTEDGYEIRHCNRCNTDYRVDLGKATGHKEEIIPAKEPTCTEKGLKEGKKCSVCGEILVAQEEIPALGHKWKATGERVEPTCDKAGYYVEECETCHEKRNVEIPKLDEHDYVQIDITPATCTDPGIITYECKICGYKFKFIDKDAPALGHDIEIIPGKAATCTEKGLTEGQICKRCGKVLVEQKEIPALEHDYIVTVVAPTCTEKGYTLHECSRCGDEFKTDYKDIDPLAHDSYISKAEVPATCTTPGATAEVSCKYCHKVLTPSVEIPALGHKEKIIPGKAPTCTETGLTEGKKCSVCGEILVEQEVIPATGHKGDKSFGKVAATCTEGAYYLKECEVCHEQFKEYIENEPALGHKYVDEIVPPTCTEKGYTKHTCSVCGHTYNDTYVDALGHTEEIIPGKAATCTETGLTDGKRCSVCGEILVEQEVIPATGHHYVDDVVAPTCTEKGYTKHTCSGCGDSYTDTEVDALGHTYVETTVPPTCTEKGYILHKCSVCGDEYRTDEIPAIGHKLVHHEGKAPTYSEVGWKEYDTCEHCDYSTYEEIPMLSENISFSFIPTGVNGSAVAVNSGYITIAIKMNVNSDIARMWGFQFSLSYDSNAVTLVGVDGNLFKVAKNTSFDIANSQGFVTLIQNNGSDPSDTVFEKGSYNVVTLTFKVADDFATQDVTFTVNENETIEINRTEPNEIVYDFGAPCDINVVRLGDANTDGKLTNEDALELAKWYAAADLDAYKTVFDMNKDGIIDGDDFALLRGAIVGDDSYLKV